MDKLFLIEEFNGEDWKPVGAQFSIPMIERDYPGFDWVTMQFARMYEGKLMLSPMVLGKMGDEYLVRVTEFFEP